MTQAVSELTLIRWKIFLITSKSYLMLQALSAAHTMVLLSEKSWAAATSLSKHARAGAAGPATIMSIKWRKTISTTKTRIADLLVTEI